MNIFFLDENPIKSARYHCDKHVVKMPLEYCQMLCDAHRILDGIQHKVKATKRQKIVYILQDEMKEKLFYKPFMPFHKCSKWIRDSIDHYGWVYETTRYLLEELQIRYGTIHKIEKSGLLKELKNPPKNLFWAGWLSNPPQAMPEDCYSDSTVTAYRNYYKKYKSHFATWKSQQPEWW